MDETRDAAEEIPIEVEHRRTAEALARTAREVAAERLPFGLEPQDFEAALERLAEPEPATGGRP
ncbi:MAG: hypothetical protein K6T74_14375 [Geminicoccaceae bacterium]|nr:hypothetical protein [Geminicoccaceae bacterium]